MHAYLLVHRVFKHEGRHIDEVLLAQKSIYLPPHRRYEFATIARNAVQYVIPGGRVDVANKEDPAHAAVREFYESTNLTINQAALKLLYSEHGHQFFVVKNVPHIDVEGINAALAEGKMHSLLYNNFMWVSLDYAQCKLGNKVEYQALPWVMNQVVRALNAGFSKELIGGRANEHHGVFTRALARLILGLFEDTQQQQAPQTSNPPPPPA